MGDIITSVPHYLMSQVKSILGDMSPCPIAIDAPASCYLRAISVYVLAKWFCDFTSTVQSVSNLNRNSLFDL